MNHTRSLLFKIVTRITFVMGLALAIVFIPNLAIFDERPLPEINQLLDNPIDPDIEGNAYYYLYGMAAASNKDPYEVGKAVIQTLQSKHAKGEFANLTEHENNTLYGGSDKWDEEWQAHPQAAKCNSRLRSDCFAQLLAALKETSSTEPRLLTQMKRYEQIIRLPHFIEDMTQLDITSPLPNFFLVMKLGELSQAKAYAESGLDGLIVTSQQDMKFWRMTLTDSQTLIGKMVAIASLRRNLSGLSYAIKHAPALTAEQIHQLQTILTPLKQEEISMEKKLVGELRFSIENWQTAPKKIPDDQSVLLWLMTQPMASANWFYRQTLKPAFAFNKMSPADFFEHAQTPTKPLEFSRFNPYNLGGKIYQSKNWEYASYIGRAHDLAGIYSLVALQLELKTIATLDWPAAIKSSRYNNPYTEKSFDYNPATNFLGFSCFSATDNCQIEL